MKNRILLFLIVFSIGIITIYPSFVNAHSLESYCTIYNGYQDTALNFLQNGKLFSALAFTIFSLVNLPFDSLSFVSSFLIAMCLSFAITKFYLMIKNNLNLENNLKKVILLISVFLIFYNPLLTEILLFDEGFVIAFGLLLVVLAIDKINQGKISNYVLAGIFMTLAALCYQGIVYCLFPLLILTLLAKYNADASFFKKIGIAILVYIASLLASFVLIKIVGEIAGVTIAKIGSIDIISNIGIIFTNLLPLALKHLYGFVNTSFYYLIVFILLALIIYLIFKNSNKKTNIILLVVLVLSCILLPFLPNLVMNSNSNYSTASMTFTLGILPSILLIYIISRFEIDCKFNYFILVILVLMFGVTAYSIHQNTMINFKRYKEDVKYIKTINERIKWYENKSDYKIKEIYIAKDTDVNYYYDFGNANSTNIRLVAVDWAMECAIPVYSDKEYKYQQMSEQDYNKYFKNKDYDEFNDKQLVFVKNKLYLLLY